MPMISITDYYGFKKPYKLPIAIVFLLNTAVATLVVLASCVLFSKGELTIGTERFIFLTYVATLSLVATALSRSIFLSLALLLWCLLELIIGVAGSGFDTHGSRSSFTLLPRNVFTDSRDLRFIYHPLLQKSLRPHYVQYVHYNERNRDKFLDAIYPELFGRDITFTHNSIGTRGRELTSEDLTKPMIFVYGGSTTYDYAVSDGETWVERLSSALDGQFTFVNWGVPGHSTTEHLIHTAFYQSAHNARPICALYYVGWNDLLNAHVKELDPAYANYLRLHLAVRQPEFAAARYSPLLRLIYMIARRRFDTIPEAPNAYMEAPKDTPDPNLEHYFSEHVRTIAAINSSRGVKTVFIGQLLNRDFLTLPRAIRLFPSIDDQHVWSVQERLNALLKQTANESGATYVDAGIDNFGPSDFADLGHFSAAGSKKFASRISTAVRQLCK